MLSIDAAVPYSPFSSMPISPPCRNCKRDPRKTGMVLGISFGLFALWCLYVWYWWKKDGWQRYGCCPNFRWKLRQGRRKRKERREFSGREKHTSWWRYEREGKEHCVKNERSNWRRWKRHKETTEEVEVDVEKGETVSKTVEKEGSIGSDMTLIGRPKSVVIPSDSSKNSDSPSSSSPTIIHTDVTSLSETESSHTIHERVDEEEPQAIIERCPHGDDCDDVLCHPPPRPKGLIIPAHLPYPQWHSCCSKYPLQGIPERDCWICCLSASEREQLQDTFTRSSSHLKIVNAHIDRPFHSQKDHFDQERIRRFDVRMGSKPCPDGVYRRWLGVEEKQDRRLWGDAVVDGED